LAVDDLGRDVVVMSAAAEGRLRDQKGRTFSFYEAANGDVESQELFLAVGTVPTDYNPYTRLDPKFQDGEYLYLQTSGGVWYNGFQTNGVWKMRFFRESAP
jgi:hypothetical protein